MIMSGDSYDPVTFVKKDLGSGVYWVATDYLKHSTGDYVMGSEREADRALSEFKGCRLPAPRLVDRIWQTADIKLSPIFMDPGPGMTTATYQGLHQERIEMRLKRLNPKKTDVIAGHKKDVVPAQRNGRTTIYGWHRPTGEVVQPVSSVHGFAYADYSQGIRLIRPVASTD